MSQAPATRRTTTPGGAMAATASPRLGLALVVIATTFPEGPPRNGRWACTWR